jgi:hypothetical protein
MGTQIVLRIRNVKIYLPMPRFELIIQFQEIDQSVFLYVDFLHALMHPNLFSLIACQYYFRCDGRFYNIVLL